MKKRFCHILSLLLLLLLPAGILSACAAPAPAPETEETPETAAPSGDVKGAMDGMVFTRDIEDDTMPGGPVKRTIEYVAPFDKCDREQDYETAWRFFEEKYGKATE